MKVFVSLGKVENCPYSRKNALNPKAWWGCLICLTVPQLGQTIAKYLLRSSFQEIPCAESQWMDIR